LFEAKLGVDILQSNILFLSIPKDYELFLFILPLLNFKTLSNEKSLMGEYNDLASDDAFSGETVPEDNSKQKEETAPGGKTVKKKAAKVAAERVKVEKPVAESNTKNNAIKKALPKKAGEAKAETIEPKPAKVKKTASEKEGERQVDSEQKPKIKRQTATKKQPLAEKQADLSTKNVAVVNPVPEQQEISGEHSITIMPPREPEKQETTLVADEQPAIDIQAEGAAESDITSSAQPVTEQSIEPAAEKELQVDDNEKSDDLAKSTQPEVRPIPAAEEKLLTAEQSVHADAVSVSGKDLSPVASPLQKITFRIKFHTNPGQSLFVTGNHVLLGNNRAEDAFPLNYLNNDYWVGTLEIPSSQHLFEDVSYNYIVKNADGTTTIEWGEDKIIVPLTHKTKEALLIDSWNSSSFIENTFYTEPFKRVLLKENITAAENEVPETITHIFRAKAPLLAKGQALCISGSIAELGEWDTANPLLLSQKEGDDWHTISLDLKNSTFPFAYKYGVFDTDSNKFIQYEDGKNRLLDDNTSPEKLTIVSDGFAVLPNTGFKGAGVAIPVFSLKSENSFGAGEFTDIKLLVDWAKQVGLKLIQILPVNDTSATHTYADSYPYAAISAFALHPLYLHLPSLVNNDNPILSFLREKQDELNKQSAVDYVAVMAAKWSFIKQVFPEQKQQVFESEAFISFFDKNKHWLVPYAAFSYLKEKYNTSDFNQWPANSTFDADEINHLTATPPDADEELSVNYYVQFHLHLQLAEATNYAHENGVILKGDIPIGIYRYSCDAWEEPLLFNMDMQAGAPPDDFAVKGQNWGFPTYNWQRMRENDFTWWKNRFKQMSHYFDAFRIDHILGFFRIWSIPMNAVEGIMGHFVPALPVHINEFSERGISFHAPRFTTPYIIDWVLSEIFGDDKEVVIAQFLDRISVTNYTLKPGFDTQRKVEAYFSTLEETEQNKKIKTGLFDLISNVILFEAEGAEGKEFHFRIAMDTTPSFRHLDGHTQYLLKELYINYFFRRQDEFWRKEAMLKLPELKRSTNMLICGEDLGMVPASVPGVMKELAILSLEIQRMPKDPSREFFHPNDAPYLSVVTPSTHDMSTIRGWWEEDRAATQRFFNNELGQWGTAPYFCEPWIARIIIMQHLYSPAMWSIFQLQDLLSIDGLLRRENPFEERINIPADSRHYWRYRMHLTLEALINESKFTEDFKSYIEKSGR